MTGLAIGVSSVKAGECALLNFGWELGYGKEGNFSFPNVAPYMRLNSLASMKPKKAHADMTVEERIGAADRRKLGGNVLSKEEKLEEAMQQYEMAIAYMGDDFMFQLMGKYHDRALAVKNPSQLNIAACLIKLKRYDEAIGQCSIFLALGAVPMKLPVMLNKSVDMFLFINFGDMGQVAAALSLLRSALNLKRPKISLSGLHFLLACTELESLCIC